MSGYTIGCSGQSFSHVVIVYINSKEERKNGIRNYSAYVLKQHIHDWCRFADLTVSQNCDVELN